MDGVLEEYVATEDEEGDVVMVEDGAVDEERGVVVADDVTDDGL